MMLSHSPKSDHAVHEAVRSVFPLLQIAVAMILLATSTASPTVSSLSSAHFTNPSSSSFIAFVPSVDVAVNLLLPTRCYSVAHCSQIARAAAATASPSIPVEDEEEEQQPSVVKQCRTTHWFGGFISTTSCDLVPAPIEEEDMVPMPAPVDMAVDPLLPVRCYSVAHCSQIARTAFAAATASSSSSIPVEEEQIPSVDEHCRTTQWFGGFISTTSCDPVPSSSSSIPLGEEEFGLCSLLYNKGFVGSALVRCMIFLAKLFWHNVGFLRQALYYSGKFLMQLAWQNNELIASWIIPCFLFFFGMPVIIPWSIRTVRAIRRSIVRNFSIGSSDSSSRKRILL